MLEHANLSVENNLEFLKKEAKSLLKRCRSLDSASLQRMRAGLPRLAGLNDAGVAQQLCLADVQHALAREHGYANWGELKRHDGPIQIVPDFSRPGADGMLPEGLNPWQWSATYTVRPEILSPLIFGRQYIIAANVLRKAEPDQVFTAYAALYERAMAIANARIAALPSPEEGMFLHTRILTQGWFRHKSVDLVRAFLTIGVVCLKKGDAGPGGENPPAPQALTAPGGMTPENATLPVAETHRRIDELYGDNDARDLSKETASIFLFSYGEYVASCSELDYKPFVERAENLTKSHYLLFDRQPGRRRRTPRIIRREWFCATHPDIAVVHIYLRE